MKKHGEGLRPRWYALCAGVLLAVLALCVCVGSVWIPLRDTVAAVWSSLWGLPAPEGISLSVIVGVRLPRVICVALAGGALAVCGGSVQGLLRNPLADGTTLGVSSGASLGAVLAIALGVSVPGVPGLGVMLMAMAFAFGSLLLILALAYRLDSSLSTHTIILIGVIFSMFAGSLISLVIAFAGHKVPSIIFWTMGSLASTGYADVLTVLAALAVCGTVLLRYARELNAFAIGEDNARHVGINVRRVKLAVLVAASSLIGICVSIGGSIGFVGLAVPHITRMVTGPNHRRLLPACLFSGAVFLLLADLLSRTVLSPRELPIGVVTSIVGSFVFIFIFYRTGKAR